MPSPIYYFGKKNSKINCIHIFSTKTYIFFILELFYQNIICHILYVAKNVSLYNIIFYNTGSLEIPYAYSQLDAIFGSWISIGCNDMDICHQTV